ncbi:helix-turn-helix domain-containing protein [Ruania alkalisoli]|uniref:Helix-turn-helix domain-containing protein n=1 Tax=Ruania alkalisoli TaxID=2779775 RepID=A0A7M1SXU7_9MICO|nr:helix-turn-helix domain-containing protein [Ruania alkalisoli]QOR71552.1 helix-turn-helix domain-containing protein [Ruania alkalisoli]
MAESTLLRGLGLLRLLVRAEGPVSASELARLSGMHPTSISRTLAGLVDGGFVRRVSYRSYAPDLGLLSLGLDAARHCPLATDPQLVMERAARLFGGLMLSLCLAWRGSLFYFAQTGLSLGTKPFVGHGYPLHLSSPGLLFALEDSQEDAIAALERSRRTFGWDRPTAQVPADPAMVLAWARGARTDDVLILRRWAGPDHVSAAIRLPDHEGHAIALTAAGPAAILGDGEIRNRLHQVKHWLTSGGII